MIPFRSDVMIIGSGPSGLACAIEAKKSGLSAIVLEKGSITDSIRRFPHDLIWFSTPELLEIGNVPFVIPTVRPTRVDTLNYYRKVARHEQLDIRQHDAVEEILHPGDEFLVRTAGGKEYRGTSVVVATGYFDNPNRLGVPGENLPHVHQYYDEPFSCVGCDVVVVGGKNSAVETSLDLYRHDARVTLVHRRPALSEGVKYWILPDIQNRINAGQIAACFDSVVTRIDGESVHLKGPEGERSIKADFVFVLIGYHQETDLLRKFGMTVDPETLAPHADPQTFETNVPGLYVAGSVVAGKFNNKIFVENGRLHAGPIVRSIIERKGRKP